VTSQRDFSLLVVAAKAAIRFLDSSRAPDPGLRRNDEYPEHE
jgi:hypothetical protein